LGAKTLRNALQEQGGALNPLKGPAPERVERGEPTLEDVFLSLAK
jgi:hypothetical protein